MGWTVLEIDGEIDGETEGISYKLDQSTASLYWWQAVYRYVRRDDAGGQATLSHNFVLPLAKRTTLLSLG